MRFLIESVYCMTWIWTLHRAHNKLKSPIEEDNIWASKEIESLPSYGTQYAMVKEMKHLSRQQAVTNSSNLTLKYDDTTIKLGHLVEVELATDNYNYLIGVQDQATAKADQYVETIENSIGKIDATPTGTRNEAVPSASDSPTNSSILHKKTNTMTDRCITNSAVDRKIESIVEHNKQISMCSASTG